MTRTFTPYAMLILLAAGCGGDATRNTPDAETTPSADKTAEVASPHTAAPGTAHPEGATGTAMDLIGSEWLLEDLAGGRVLDNVQATIAFPEPGRVAGVGSCNRFNGPCTLGTIAVTGGEGSSRDSAVTGGATFSVGPLATTRKACVPAVGEQEQRYLAALQAAERIEIEGRTLRVYTQGAEKPLRYARITP
jgi:heat shock protein HslJ